MDFADLEVAQAFRAGHGIAYPPGGQVNQAELRVDLVRNIAVHPNRFLRRLWPMRPRYQIRLQYLPSHLGDLIDRLPRYTVPRSSRGQVRDLTSPSVGRQDPNGDLCTRLAGS
jgi:hypothetical protein